MKTEWKDFDDYINDRKIDFEQSLVDYKKKFSVNTLYHEDGTEMTLESLLETTYNQYLEIKKFEKNFKVS